MPELRVVADIRGRLEADRSWALYALGDLAPEQAQHCRWFGTPDGAVTLLYLAFDVPVFFAAGAPGSVRTLLAEIDEPEMFVLTRPDNMPVLAERYTLDPVFPAWRMILHPRHDAGHALRQTGSDVCRLSMNDLPSIDRLYAGDVRTDGDPRFFTPLMLEQGVYYGVREGEELAAVAGTHLVVPGEGVGALGNVYTRRDRRGRGLAARTVGAVVRHLINIELRTIGLNVAQANLPAIRLYERLGFTRYCPYIEAHATRS